MRTRALGRPYLDVDGEALPSRGVAAEPHELSWGPADRRSTVLPVTRQECEGGTRTVGVFEATPDGLRWHPAVDVQRLAERGQVVAVLGALAATVGWVAQGWAQGRPAVGRVTMGPGGWISVRVPRGGAGRRDVRPHEAGRPLWARLTHADRLIVARPGRR